MKFVCPECIEKHGRHQEWCSFGRNWLPEWLKLWLYLVVLLTLLNACTPCEVFVGMKQAGEASGLGGRKARPGEVPDK